MDLDLDALIFDKDGTLFDFEATWGHWAKGVLDGLAQDHGIDGAALGRAIGFDIATLTFTPDSPVVAGTPREIAADVLPHLPSPPDLDTFVADLNAQAAFAPQIEVTSLGPLFDLLARRFKLGVVTNDAHSAARAHLATAQVLDQFDVVYGSDSGVGFKPDPAPVLAACHAMGVAPARTAMIGDSLHDLHAGRAAGCVTIGVTTGPAPAAMLAPHADLVLGSIADLPGVLSKT